MELTIGNKKIITSSLGIFILLIFFLPNAYFETFPIYNFICFGLSMLLGVFVLVFDRKFLIRESILKYIVLYYLYSFIVLLFQDSSELKNFYLVFGWTLFSILSIDYLMRKQFKRTLIVFDYLCIFMLIANLVTLLLFPNGIWTDVIRAGYSRAGYIFGIGNAFSYYIFPIIFILLISSICVEGKKYINFFGIFIGIITLLLGTSSTGKLIAILFVMLVLAGRTREFLKWITWKRLFVIYALIWLFVVVFQNIEFISQPIAQLVGKDSTFSERAYIWQQSIYMISKHPIFGSGYVSGGGVIAIGSATYSSHNVILQVLIERGLVGLFLLIIVIMKAMKDIYDLQKVNKKYGYYISISVFSILMTFLMEAYSVYYLFIILILISNLTDYLNRKEDSF